jgi:hypothetical protein
MKRTRSNQVFTQMTTNPIIENYVEDSKYHVLLKRYAHKFMIIGLYHWSKPVREEQFDEARLYCRDHHITFKLEAFNDGIEEDREMIERLPAFHLYVDEEYELSFYPEQTIAIVVKEYITKNLDKRSKPKKKWSFTLPKFSIPSFRFKRSIASSKEA